MSKIIYLAREFYPYIFLNTLILIVSIATLFKITKSQISNRIKLIVVSIFATILFFSLNFTLAEAYFRFIYDHSDGLGYLKVSEKWHQRHVKYNGDFRRDREFILKKTSGILRICAIGDSITFGYGIKNPEDRYPNILEKTLRQNGEKVEIYNLAVSGTNLSDSVTTYKLYKFLDCDLILYQYALNDIRNNEEQAKTLEQFKKVSPLVKSAQNFSYFFDFMYWRLNQKYNNSFRSLQAIDTKDFENEEKLSRHLLEISQFVKEIRSDQKKMIVIIFPMFYSLDNTYPGWIHALIGGYFRKEGAQVVDLLPLAIGKDLNDLRASRFDAHPNEYFHSLAAKEVYEPLKMLLK